MVADGVDGFELIDYSWNPKTGVGTYEYERVLDSGAKQTETVKKAQPYHPTHAGWYTGALT